MGLVPEDKAQGRKLQGKIATQRCRVEHFAGKLLVGGTVRSEHLDGVPDVDLHFKVGCPPVPAGIQACMQNPSSAETRHGCMNCLSDATCCAASVANLSQAAHTHVKVAVSGRVFDQQPTVAFIQHNTDACCLAQE
jgi:hypothetical protein